MTNRVIKVFLVVAIVIVVAVLFFRVLPMKVDETVTTLTTPTEAQVDLATVVTRVRDLNRLETASMHVVNVSTITQSYKLVPNTLGGDELTLFASGDVIAGIDLSRLAPTDIRRDPDGTVVVKLPRPEILVTRLDNRETKVVNRKTGLFRRSDPDLESHARQYAETGIRKEALNKGILQMAGSNGETRLAQFIGALGIERVRFVHDGATKPE